VDATAAESIRLLCQSIDSNRGLPRAEVLAALDLFEHHECWEPFQSLVHQILSKGPDLQLLVRWARVQNMFLHDAESAAKTCGRIASDAGIGFNKLKNEILPLIIVGQDYPTEALILQNALPQFSPKKDQVACLERLCLIYEKKNHNEVLLDKYYTQLLSLDQGNQKALRYFKMIFTQSQRWQEVIGILQAMIKHAAHPQDTYRSAQELAAVFMYQLDRPQDAIAVIEQHCKNSPLDTSLIHYDAYYQMGDAAGCLRVLRYCLDSLHDERSRGVLLYKIALLEEKLGDLNSAKKSLAESAKTSPSFIEPIENLINIAVFERNWKQLMPLLDELAQRTDNPESVERIREASKRLENGIQNADA